MSDDHDTVTVPRAEWDRLNAALAREAAKVHDLLRKLSDEAARRGHAEGLLAGIGWNGGVEATLDAFREENDRLRQELAELRASVKGIQ